MSNSDDNNDSMITIQLKDSQNVQMHFELEQPDTLEGVLTKYSEFKKQSLDVLQFSYKGKVISPKDSPSSLEMTAEDSTIQVSLTGDALTKEQIAQACTAGDVSTAIDLLSKNNELIEERLTWFDSDGQELNTPCIFIAIDYGHVELVTKLLPLHKGIIDTLKEGDGDYTALSWASWTGQMEIVKLLVEKGGATVEEEALQLARDDDHHEVSEYLLKHVDLYSNLKGDEDGIMEKACREGDANMVRKMLEEDNYDIGKWKDESGKFLAFSPMYLAVKNGHIEVISLFAEMGVNMDELDVIPECEFKR